MSDQLLKEILGEVQNLNRRFSSLEEDQSKIVSKVDILESKIDGVESSVTNLNSKVDALETSVGSLKGKVDGLENRFDGLDSKVDRLESTQLKVETRIENEVIDKIRILFDAHSLYLDYFASLRDGQARIEDGIESLIRRSIDTNARITEHDRELRLLRLKR